MSQKWLLSDFLQSPGGGIRNFADRYIRSLEPPNKLRLNIKTSNLLIINLYIFLLYVIIGDFPTVCLVD